MNGRPQWVLVVAAVAFLLAGGVVAAQVGLFDRGDYEWTTVTAVDGETDEELAVIEVRIADTWEKRYTGLSNTESLDENEGMLFIHDSEGEQSYVMRNMDFSIDIVFIDAGGEITTIHHAEVDDDGTFQGTGQYILEVPYHYTTDNGIAVGDRIEIPDEYR